MIHFENKNKVEFNSASDKTNGRVPKILIVENEAIIAEDLRVRLEQMGYEVTAVTASGKSAIDFAKQNQPDILLIDPDGHQDEISGTEAAVILQGHFGEFMPVVFVTSHSEKDFPLFDAVDSYVYLKKPFSNEDLTSSLKKAVDLIRNINP